jgi:regulator of RNase E activity RraA
MSSGYCRIRTAIDRVPEALTKAYQGFPSSGVADALIRSRPCSMRGVVPIPYPGFPLVGPALTVCTRTQDNLLPHKAMDLAQPGDVIVIAAGGFDDCGIIGEQMALYAMSRGVAGFVIDGMVRDSEFFLQVKFPVYALGTSPRGPMRTGEGSINFPVVCAGVQVHPGDLLVCDADGVTVVPRLEAAGTLDSTRAILETEEKNMQAIRAGKAERSWVEKTLRERGVEYV